jgi:hypothetical protein
VGLAPSPRRTYRFCAAWALFGAIAPGAGALAQEAYTPIVAARASESIVLTGRDLSIDQLTAIASAAEFYAPLAKDIDGDQ